MTHIIATSLPTLLLSFTELLLSSRHCPKFNTYWLINLVRRSFFSFYRWQHISSKKSNDFLRSEAWKVIGLEFSSKSAGLQNMDILLLVILPSLTLSPQQPPCRKWAWSPPPYYLIWTLVISVTMKSNFWGKNCVSLKKITAS